MNRIVRTTLAIVGVLLVLLQLGIMMNTHSINTLGLVLLVGGILLLLFVINLQNFWAKHWWQFWK
jgi:uncharacterized membrane protein